MQLEKNEIPTNPLLQRVKLPGKIFQLPSRGIFYTNGELDSSVKNGEIHVHAMSAIDEINMKNPDMLFSGKAIEEVCKTCVSEIKIPKNLLARDVDAILLFLRLITYGNLFEIQIKHTCENAKEQTYSINLEKLIGEMTYLDPTSSDEEYSLTLPNGQVVKFQPARYYHVIELLQATESKTEYSAKDIQDHIMKNLLNLIINVDGITDKKNIEEWLRIIEVKYMNQIAKRIESLNKWGPKTETKIICRDCKTEMDVDIPINPINFFSE